MSHREYRTAQKLIGRLGALALGALASASISVLAQEGPATSTSDPLQELKLDGAVPGAAGPGNAMCSPMALGRYHGDVVASMNEAIAEINAQMQIKDFSGALGKSRLAAQGFSYCYAKYGKDSDAPLYAAAVGHFLTEEAIAGRAANTDTPEVLHAPARARVLLRYAQGAGRDTSADLAALDKLDPPHHLTNTGGPAIQLTAEAAVDGYKGNQLRFDTQYNNQTLQITGPARKVSEAIGGGVWIIIVGHKPDKSFADDVVCVINDSDANQKAKAAALNIPGPVTVAGTYRSAHGAFVGGSSMQLHDCQVVDVPPTTPKPP